MEAVLNITAPIFFLILLGYLGSRFHLLPKESIPGLSRFVLYFALPALVFTKLLSMDLGDVVNADYMMVYAAGGLSSLVFTVFLCRLYFKEQWETCGVKGLGASVSNSAFIGFPVLLQFFGHPPTQAFAMSVMVENIILFPVGLIFVESMQGRRHANGRSLLKPVMKRVLSNPIILAVFFGAVGSACGLTLPVFMARSLDILSLGATSAALIVIGGSLVGVSIRGQVGEMFAVAFSKLVFFPLVVVGLLLLTPNMPSDLKVSVILFAAMPMFSIYPIIGGEYGERSFCASTLLITTVLSFLSLSVLLHFLV